MACLLSVSFNISPLFELCVSCCLCELLAFSDGAMVERCGSIFIPTIHMVLCSYLEYVLSIPRVYGILINTIIAQFTERLTDEYRIERHFRPCLCDYRGIER